MVDADFGYRVFRLTDHGAHIAYSYWPSLNADNTVLLGFADGGAKLWNVTFGDTTVRLSGERDAFGGGIPLWWEGFVWDRSDPSVGYGIYGSTGTARLYRHDVEAQRTTLLKDFDSDRRYTGFWDRSTYLWQLMSNLDQTRFCATVRESRGGAEIGAVIWDRGSDELWNYNPPSGKIIDECALDREGRYFLAALSGREWQVWDLESMEPGPVQLPESPVHKDVGWGVAFQGHGAGMKRVKLTAPYDSEQVYTAETRGGVTNPYSDAHTSTLSNDGFVYAATYVDMDVTESWTLVSGPGPVWCLDWGAEMERWVNRKLPPEVVRRGRVQLTRVERMPSKPGEWSFDPTEKSLCVWNDDGSDPNAQSMIVFDWRPMMDEIWRVSEDGSVVDRLAHHYSHVAGYWDTPRANVSYDGDYVVFNSNWGGQPQVDIFAVRTTRDQ
jgi:hypothetical protein